MSDIILLPITLENWKQCIALAADESQREFVPSNLYSIAEAQFYPDARPLAIYNVDEQMVGFVMYGRDVFTGKWKIFRLMIDAIQQRKGYGRAAMEQVIHDIQQQPDGDEILICYHDTNEGARRLYGALGFVEQEIDETGKVAANLTPKPHSIQWRGGVKDRTRL